MSIRLLARDLYRCQQKVGELEKAMASAAPENKRLLEEQLRRARAERDQLRRMLDGQIGR
jgi:hypothetical protein